MNHADEKEAMSELSTGKRLLFFVWYNSYVMKQISAGILAHVDAGKTTCIETFLFHSGVIRRMGRVDHKDAALDYDEQERARGITIYAKEASITWNEVKVNLIDTPGHVDFSGEMERALSVIDAAIVLISGLDGVQAHTETIMSCLSHYRIPVLFFINKMDIAHKSEEELMEDLSAHFSGCILWNKEDTEENLAMVNEPMMNAYLEEGHISEALIQNAFMNREFFPVLFGSALKDQGIIELMDLLTRLTKEKQWREAFGARIFRITNGSEGRLTHVRITGGVLNARDRITETEKADIVRVLNGTNYETVTSVKAGDIAVLSGIRSKEAGEGLGFEEQRQKPMLEACMVYEIETDNLKDRRMLFEVCRNLSDEDPTLSVVTDEDTGAIRISIMGEMQKEILHHRILEATGIDVNFGTGRILYRETIKEPVHGAGHFEPLRHYAEVHVRLEPAERDSGINVRSIVSTDDLPMHWQNAILSSLRTIPHRGVLTGSPLSDVNIILTAGKGHLKHTEGGDFRNAARRAVRQALMKADNVLLEPFCSFELDLSSEYVSHALYDLETRGAQFTVNETPTGIQITGEGPFRTMMNYQADVTAYTRGTGHCVQQPIGYRECSDAEAVIQEKGYDPLGDKFNPPGSVFCTHGSSFNVSWEESDAFMNIPVKDRVSESVYSHRTYHVGEDELKSIIASESGMNRNPNKEKKVVEEDNHKYKMKTMPDLPVCLIVDGYNVLHAFESTHDLASQDITAARERLIDELGAYQAYTNERMIVVFDGYRRKENYGSKEHSGKLEIVYTATGETADEHIEKLASSLAGKYRLRVATSDGLIQNSVFAHGAERISARMLEQAMETVKKMFETR